MSSNVHWIFYVSSNSFIQMEKFTRIKYALLCVSWKYGIDGQIKLKSSAKPITPDDYDPSMKGSIFCPECTGPLFRSPEQKNYAANGKIAFFAHNRNYETICSLRVRKSDGEKFNHEEETSQVESLDNFIKIESFLSEKPIAPDINGPTFYKGSAVEDANGKLADRPIARSTGEIFHLPNKFRTVQGLCRKFNENLDKYIQLPGQEAPQKLKDQLINIKTVEDATDVKKLFFGKIIRSSNMGKTDSNLRMSYFEYRSKNQADFCVKLIDRTSKEHGIDDNSVGKIILVYGKVTISGVGLCITSPGWGEIAVLPQKYHNLLKI